MEAGLEEKIKLYRKEWQKKNWWKYLIWFIWPIVFVISLAYENYAVGILSACSLIAFRIYLNNQQMAYAEKKAFEQTSEKETVKK